MVTSLFTRLGAVGLSLIAGALIFGALAGAVVVNRIDRAQPAASSQDQGQPQHDDGKQLGQNKKKNGNQDNPGHGQPKQSDDQGDSESD